MRVILSPDDCSLTLQVMLWWKSATLSQNGARRRRHRRIRVCGWELGLRRRSLLCPHVPLSSEFGHKARAGVRFFSLALLPIVVGIRYNSSVQLVTRLSLGQLCVGGRLPPPNRSLFLLCPLVNAT